MSFFTTPLFISFAVFGFVSLCATWLFLFALDREKINTDRKLIGAFTRAYWSQNNIQHACRPRWVKPLLVMRWLVIASLAVAIVTLAVTYT